MASMKAGRLRVTAAMCGLLAVWFGLLSGLPHTHGDRRPSTAEQICAAVNAVQPTSHLHRPQPARSQDPCLACLIQGNSAAPADAAVIGQPAASVETAATGFDIPRSCVRPHLPNQRGPPVSV